MLGYRALDYSLRHHVPKQFPIPCLLMSENGPQSLTSQNDTKSHHPADFRLLPLRARRLSAPAAADFVSPQEEWKPPPTPRAIFPVNLPIFMHLFPTCSVEKRMFALTLSLFLSLGLGDLRVERAWSL